MIEILWDDGDGLSHLLLMDAVPSETHRIAAQATDHEVERGVAVVDHVKPDPRMLVVQALIAGAPLKPDENDASPTRVRDQWKVLLEARDLGLLATITTGIETYRDMVLLEAHADRTAVDAEWLKVDLTFKQIRFVSTQLVADPTPARARDRRQVDRGSQATVAAPPARAAAASFLLQAARAGGVTFGGLQ